MCCQQWYGGTRVVGSDTSLGPPRFSRFSQARAQELQLENQVLGRLDELLRRCGKDPGSAQAISNWLCAEGIEGHAKKGLARILWCVPKGRNHPPPLPNHVP